VWKISRVSSTIRDHLAFLYGESSAGPFEIEFENLIATARKNLSGREKEARRPGPGDCMLITYADQISAEGEPPLRTLGKFLARHTSGFVTSVHILPFYPSSSDDGFSVMDYYAVDPAFGTWDDISALEQRFHLMFDAVFNHASAQGTWFARFLAQEPTWEGAFFTVSGNPDLSQVVRPRALPLLTEFSTSRGARKVWTTFSADQVDINAADPRMLLRLLEVLFFYLEKGARYVRLDAIAFLWKIPGTRCIHLEQTHRIIKLMRTAIDEVAPGVQLITETNVPHSDNISYFGNGRDEAHLVYNFALPPLVFHTIRTGDADALRRWAATLELPSEEATFFNFLASHDGIGLNPARGILESTEIDALVATVLAHGGYVSYKNNPDGSKSPYELNISYFDALSNPAGGESIDLQAARFLAAHAILLALRGLPAIYFHSLFGSRSDRAGAESSGIPRRINRKKLNLDNLDSELGDESSLRRRVFSGIQSMLEARGSQPAFSPYSGQTIPDAPCEVFVIERVSESSRVLAVVNVTDREQHYSLPEEQGWQAILGSECQFEPGALRLPAYGVCWLSAA
jgi:glycosidase